MPNIKLPEVYNTENYTIVTRDAGGKPLRAKCVHCDLEQAWNVSRLFEHLQRHKAVGHGDPTKNKRRLEAHFLPEVTPDQQALADRRLVFAAIMNGWSYRSLESAALERFVKVLRPGYVVPSRHFMGKFRDELYTDLQAVANNKLVRSKRVTLAFDGWCNHKHTTTLAIVAVTADGEAILLTLKEVERETSEVHPCSPVYAPVFFFCSSDVGSRG